MTDPHPTAHGPTRAFCDELDAAQTSFEKQRRTTPLTLGTPVTVFDASGNATVMPYGTDALIASALAIVTPHTRRYARAACVTAHAQRLCGQREETRP